MANEDRPVEACRRTHRVEIGDRLIERERPLQASGPAAAALVVAHAVKEAGEQVSQTVEVVPDARSTVAENGRATPATRGCPQDHPVVGFDSHDGFIVSERAAPGLLRGYPDVPSASSRSV